MPLQLGQGSDVVPEVSETLERKTQQSAEAHAQAVMLLGARQFLLRSPHPLPCEEGEGEEQQEEVSASS